MVLKYRIFFSPIVSNPTKKRLGMQFAHARPNASVIYRLELDSAMLFVMNSRSSYASRTSFVTTIATLYACAICFSLLDMMKRSFDLADISLRLLLKSH